MIPSPMYWSTTPPSASIAGPMPPNPAEDELRAALPALREVLARPEIWERHGDLALHAERAWIDLICGPDLVLAEALIHKTEAMKDELAGPAPTPLERLLVGQIVAVWLQVKYESARQAQARDVPPRHAEVSSRRLARANRGLLMAVRRVLPSAPGPAASGAISTRTGEYAPGVDPGEPGPAGPEAVVPLTEDNDRVENPAGPGTLALFDRPDVAPGRARLGWLGCLLTCIGSSQAQEAKEIRFREGRAAIANSERGF